MRLHRSPSSTEIAACKPWLREELRLIEPEVILCLGASAAQAVLGKAVKIEPIRGQIIHATASKNTIVTYHPSAILRAEIGPARQHLYDCLVQDLRLASSKLKPQSGALEPQVTGSADATELDSEP
ncbi:MAG: hypothetical protein EOP09_17785 [Proteobacteria bacterium]|nr:MAG: hypothetical protein EOP09_17785 [Pseudomonadota bacterium]